MKPRPNQSELDNPIYAARHPRITSNPKPSGWGASPRRQVRKMHRYTREEREIRERKRGRAFTVFLRFFCALVSCSIAGFFVWLVSTGKIDEIIRGADGQDHILMKIGLVLFGLFLMTGLYAIKGDRALSFICESFE